MLSINFKNRFFSFINCKFFIIAIATFLLLQASIVAGEGFSILTPEAENLKGFIEALKAFKPKKGTDEGTKIECQDQVLKIQGQFLDLVASVEDKKNKIPKADEEEAVANFSKLTQKYYKILKKVNPLLQKDLIFSTEELNHPVLYGIHFLASMGLPSDAKEMSREGIEENIKLLREKYCLSPEAILYFLTRHLTKSTSIIVPQDITSDIIVYQKVPSVPLSTRYQILLQNVLQMGYNPVPTKASECGIFQVMLQIPEEHKKIDFLEELCKAYRGPHFEPLLQEFGVMFSSMSSFLVDPIYTYFVNNPKFPKELVDNIIELTKTKKAEYVEKYNKLTIALARKCLPGNFERILERIHQIEEYYKSKIAPKEDSKETERERCEREEQWKDAEARDKARIYFNLLKNKNLTMQNHKRIEQLKAKLPHEYQEVMDRKLKRHQGVSIGKSVLLDPYWVLTQADPEIQKKKEFYTEVQTIPIARVKIHPRSGLNLIYLQNPVLDIPPIKRYYGTQVDGSRLDFVKDRFAYIEDTEDHSLLYGTYNSSRYDFEQLPQKFQDWLNFIIIKGALE